MCFFFFFLQITNRLYALIAKISKNKAKLDLLIEKSSILQNEQRLDQYMCMVLMTELLFGAQKLNGESKPVQCVRGYESKFRDILKDIDSDPANSTLQSIGSNQLNHFVVFLSYFRLVDRELTSKHFSEENGQK